MKNLIKINLRTEKIGKAKSIGIYFFCLTFLLSNVTINSQSSLEEKVPSKYNMGFSNEIFLDVDMQDAKAALKLLSSKYLEEAGLNYETEITVFNDPEAYQENELDIAFLLSSEFLRIKEDPEIHPLTVPLIQDDVYTKFLLLIKRNSGISNLSDLRGKKIVVQSNFNLEHSLVFMWLDIMLIKNFGERHDTFFSDVQVVQNGSNVVLPVFFNNSDACIVLDYIYDTLSELNPQLKKQLNPLIVSPGYLLSVTCITNSSKNKEHEQILDALLNMHKDAKGKQLLTIFNTNQQIRYKEEYLENVKKIVKEYNYLVNKPTLYNYTKK